MALSRLVVRDFRTIVFDDLSLAANFNFGVGANANISGKTSVWAAIYTLSHGHVFRNLQSGRVIRHE